MRRTIALIRKESLQIIRDPSSILIALALPLILLFIFGYGVNLDNNLLKIGLVIEDRSADVSSLTQAFTGSTAFKVRTATDRRQHEPFLVSEDLRAIVIIPQAFTAHSQINGFSGKIQLLVDGSQPNIASFALDYVQGAVKTWLSHEAEDVGKNTFTNLIKPQSRVWYNSELKSRNFLVPGSIAIIMTLIGTLLTALVIAREWERGTMEALLATPVTILEILSGKLIPYFLLGILSMIVCFTIATLWYDIPFRGTFSALLLCTSVFLLAALGQGLLISSVAKDQFMASQMAIMSAFLPAFMLSGFVFEITAMPKPIQLLTHLFAVRYLVTCLQTVFLTGNIWILLLKSMGAMLIIASVFFLLTVRKSKKRLDG